MKILGCFLILSFSLPAVPAEDIKIQNLTVGKTLNIIQVSAGVAFSF
jgi:hypothetical protein